MTIETETHRVGVDYSPVDVEPMSAEIDLDNERSRIHDGKRYIRIFVRVAGTSDALGGSLVGAKMFTLNEDDVPRAPADVEGGTGVGADDSIDVVVLFEVDALYETISLTAGQPGKDQATWEITR